MTEHKYPDYIELLKLKESHSIYVMTALVLGIDPRFLKITPAVINLDGEELFTYEHSDSSSQSWYYPMKADDCSIDDYLKQESKTHPLAPVEGSNSLGIYNKGLQDILYQELKERLVEAVKSKEIECEFPECVSEDVRLKNISEGYLVKMESVRKWFQKNNFNTPFFDKPSTSEGVPSVLDKNHPEYSLELGIAIEAWQRFSGLNLTHPKAYIKKWLDEQYGEANVKDKAQITVSKKAMDRIVTLINWNSSGGTTTEGFKQSIYEQALAKDLSKKL